MRIALIAPPFIPIPPRKYGGTELFIGHMAEGLDRLGVEVVVYTNGESTVPVERRWLFEKGKWPLPTDIYSNLHDINHTAWAVADASNTCDIIHLNNAPGLVHSRFSNLPFVYTLHHPKDADLTSFYAYHPKVQYVTISEFQQLQEPFKNIRTIRHGIDVSLYQLTERKQQYVSFLGRIAPVKGPHLAIAAAKKAGIPLKIAGEIQPLFQDYWEREVKPHVDGTNVEYVGEADFATKNELLGNSLAMLFPIQWDEPFGLVMVEAMACGTPVLALPGGSVPEIVSHGKSGFICSSAGDIARRIGQAGQFVPADVRAYVEKHFSVERMVKEYIALYSKLLHIPIRQAVEDLDEEKRAIA